MFILFKRAIRRQGLCLEGNIGDEMGQHISEHCTGRNVHFKENEAILAGGDDNNTNGDERNEKDEEIQRVPLTT